MNLVEQARKKLQEEQAKIQIESQKWQARKDSREKDAIRVTKIILAQLEGSLGDCVVDYKYSDAHFSILKDGKVVAWVEASHTFQQRCDIDGYPEGEGTWTLIKKFYTVGLMGQMTYYSVEDMVYELVKRGIL